MVRGNDIKRDMKISVCVFGSSSLKTCDSFVNCSFKLGELLSERGHTCVNGAGKFGCMGAVTRGCLVNNGNVIGVIHKKWSVDWDENTEIKTLIRVGGNDLDERKRLLMEKGDCIISLPGGVGTFDELWDAVDCKNLDFKGMKHKPICLINIDNFYDGFIQQLNRAYKEGLLYAPVEEYFYVAKDHIDALNWCETQVILMKSKYPSSSLPITTDTSSSSVDVNINSRKSQKTIPEKAITNTTTTFVTSPTIFHHKLTVLSIFSIGVIVGIVSSRYVTTRK